MVSNLVGAILVSMYGAPEAPTSYYGSSYDELRGTEMVAYGMEARSAEEDSTELPEFVGDMAPEFDSEELSASDDAVEVFDPALEEMDDETGAMVGGTLGAGVGWGIGYAVGGAIGAGVGFVGGGPVGAAAGWAAGSQMGGRVGAVAGGSFGASYGDHHWDLNPGR